MLNQNDAEKKTQVLDAAIQQIEKQFGKGSIMRLGDDNPKYEIPCVSTGSLELDVALGIGGLPRGRIIEIYGPESSGKTTLTLHVVAEAQKTAGLPPSSTRSTPLIRSTPRSSASTPMSSWSPSPTPARRPWRSPRPW